MNTELTVSVIIPVYNDPQGAQMTLESLTAQSSSSPEHEIIIVDNGSTDDTVSTVTEFTDNDHIRLIVEDTVQGSYAARNAGIKASSGDILAFIDADMTVDHDWLSRVIDEMCNNKTYYMGCKVDLYSEGTESLVGKYNRLTGFPVRHYIEDKNFAPTCCLTTRREVFNEVGLFDQRLISGGDWEFGNRVAEAGYELTYCPDITMYHPTRSDLKSNLKKAYRIGRGAYQRNKYHSYTINEGGDRKSMSERIGGPGITQHERVAFYLLRRAFKGARAVGYAKEFVEVTIN